MPHSVAIPTDGGFKNGVHHATISEGLAGGIALAGGEEQAG